jgi:2-oxoglutarate ferredoxin oxidoreductase subunit alpha
MTALALDALKGPIGAQTEVNWMIGGPQGTGVDSSATLFLRTAAAAGYYVFGKREYHSNIKGKHSYFNVRASHEYIRSSVDPIDMLATFDKETATTHGHEILKNGALIYDPKVVKLEDIEGLDPSVKTYVLDYDGMIKNMAEETGSNPMKLTIMKNTLAVAASMALYGVPLEAMERALKGLFPGKKAKLVELNMLGATKAYAAMQQYADVNDFAYRLAPMVNAPAEGSRLLMNGATASGLGKLKAGCRLVTYYSITPAVDECIYLEGRPEYGMVVMQCEDELSAMNMVNGAATTGMRAATATSGPGFCLMAEGIGWAGMNEVPAVIFNYQRGGPSTGLPTRSEQADLMFAVNIGHGEFPRVVIAPGDMQECFEDSYDCFNIAERYQTPVMVLPDKVLANNTQTIDFFNEKGLKIDRGNLFEPTTKKPFEDVDAAIATHTRFEVTENGQSRRSLPGQPGGIHWLTGDEHTTIGHITEDPDIRMAQHEKRYRKMEYLLKELPQDRQFKLYGPADADITVVAWGATKGPVLDAMPLLEAQGIKVNMLHVRLFSPFPTDGVEKILKASKKLVSIEMNMTSQLARLIRMELGILIPHKVVKYTGRPISQTEVISSLTDIQQNGTERIVLTYGH